MQKHFRFSNCEFFPYFNSKYYYFSILLLTYVVIALPTCISKSCIGCTFVYSFFSLLLLICYPSSNYSKKKLP